MEDPFARKMMTAFFLFGIVASIAAIGGALSEGEPVMALVGGLIFIIVTVGFWFTHTYEKRKKGKARKDLAEAKVNALKVQGHFLKIVHDTYHHPMSSHDVNAGGDTTTYDYLICDWFNPEDQHYYIFSKLLTMEQNNQLVEGNIDTFDIYMKKENWKNYEIDLSFLG